VDDGSTIYLPFFISFYYCMYDRMLVLSCFCNAGVVVAYCYC